MGDCRKTPRYDPQCLEEISEKCPYIGKRFYSYRAQHGYVAVGLDRFGDPEKESRIPLLEASDLRMQCIGECRLHLPTGVSWKDVWTKMETSQFADAYLWGFQKSYMAWKCCI